MPLPKRGIEPVHVARGTLPEDFPLPSELEAVTNGTLANTVRQLSSLSKHAEDLFGELARDAQQINERSNSLQARIDRLAIKVTMLDSTVEEVSLQDIHMRKAFKSQVVFDQQIFSRGTMPTAMLETYKSCDKPPPLDKLNCYRDDGKDGLKFYTDPNYFFELWRQEILIDTERMMHDKSKKPHRPRTAVDQTGQGQRPKKRVRQPHNTRERQKQIAMGHGEYIMPPQNTIYRTPGPIQQHPAQMQMTEEYMLDQHRPPRPNSIEIRRSYQQMPGVQPQEMTDGPPHSPTYPPQGVAYHHQQDQQPPGGQMQYPPPPVPLHQGPLSSDSLHQQAGGSAAGTPTKGRGVGQGPRPSQPPPAPPTPQSGGGTPTRARPGRDMLPPPPPPPDVCVSPPNGIPAHLVRSQSQSRSGSPHSLQTTSPEPVQELPPPPPVTKQASPPKQQPPQLLPAVVMPQPQQQVAPPPPPPPPMPVMTNGPINNTMTSPPLVNGDLAKILNSTPPKLTPVKDRILKQAPLPAMVDPRNDLLKAIRDGIKLRKVEKIEQKELERGNGLHDVASILARRVAVEFSDSESGSDSECDSEGWGENETSA